MFATKVVILKSNAGSKYVLFSISYPLLGNSYRFLFHYYTRSCADAAIPSRSEVFHMLVLASLSF